MLAALRRRSRGHPKARAFNGCMRRVTVEGFLVRQLCSHSLWGAEWCHAGLPLNCIMQYDIPTDASWASLPLLLKLPCKHARHTMVANFILNRPPPTPATLGLIMLWSWATAHCSDYMPQSSSGGYTGPVLLVPTPTQHQRYFSNYKTKI